MDSGVPSNETFWRDLGPYRSYNGGSTVDSTKLEYRCGTIYAGCCSFFSFGLELEDGQVPTCWLLLQIGGSGCDPRIRNPKNTVGIY